MTVRHQHDIDMRQRVEGDAGIVDAASDRQTKSVRPVSTRRDRPGCSAQRSGSASSHGRRRTAAPCRHRRAAAACRHVGSAPIPARRCAAAVGRTASAGPRQATSAARRRDRKSARRRNDRRRGRNIFMRDNQIVGTPIATPNPARKARERRRVIFMAELVPIKAVFRKGRSLTNACGGESRQVSLTFEACGVLRRPLSRKDFLFDPPTGPGGRRSTPDSAMRPRARSAWNDVITAHWQSRAVRHKLARHKLRSSSPAKAGDPVFQRRS